MDETHKNLVITSNLSALVDVLPEFYEAIRKSVTIGRMKMNQKVAARAQKKIHSTRVG